jgi:hypothetical protein
VVVGEGLGERSREGVRLAVGDSSLVQVGLRVKVGGGLQRAGLRRQAQRNQAQAVAGESSQDDASQDVTKTVALTTAVIFNGLHEPDLEYLMITPAGRHGKPDFRSTICGKNDG